MFLTDKPYHSYNQFMGSFWLSIILGFTSSPTLGLALFFLYLHSNFPHIDLGNSMAFSSMMKGILEKDGTNPIDWLIIFGLQFGGAFVGGIVWCLISGVASTPGAPVYGDNDGRGIFYYLFACMVQSAAFYNLGRDDNGQFGCFKVVAVYFLSWELASKAFTGAVGGVSVDFGRMLASKLIPSVQGDMSKFWVLLVGGFAGMAAGPLVMMIDGKIRAKQDGAGGGDAAADDAGNEA